MYDKSDPRSALASAAPSSSAAPTAFAGAELGLFYDEPPQDNDANGKTWYCRGQNFVVAYTDAKPGVVFKRDGQRDEYVVIVPDKNTPVVASAKGQTEKVDGFSLIIMPPGDGAITLEKGGRIVRLFSSQSPDLNAKCANATSYAEPHPNIPPFQAWPAPKDGFKIRTYSLDVPKEPGRFGRIWRCTTVMVNFLDEQMGPRDIHKLSPHHHDDFEQCSLALDGSFIHHLRWPWTVDMDMWRADEHPHVKSPSVTVIPPPAIHTTRGMEPGLNQLVDIFSPPRLDFSQKKGWVLNADDYPMPQ
ncbi:MAG: hypothetical protein BGP06_07940 [Rhizobiales bacterium 65-9]|nr:hypothetical protein [Hyphomicrobiales bacterium]OJY33798.1 MAG: hypothetical protein BGP06_07940 [Rhizobiales bacterium 65-9]